VNLMVRYKPTDSLTLDLMHRWRSSLGLTPDPTAVSIGRVKSAQYTTINVGYRVLAASHPLDLFLNVQNLFDKEPPPANFNGTAGSPGLFGGFPIGDDPIGRYYTAGLKYQF
jgi:outer membrane receptor protein involved in Fe transport